MVHFGLVGLLKRLKKYHWHYLRQLSDDCDICQKLEMVKDKILESGIDIGDMAYCNENYVLGKHYIKGVLDKDNYFEIRTFFAYLTPTAKYIKLSASKEDTGTKRLQEIIDDVI